MGASAGMESFPIPPDLAQPSNRRDRPVRETIAVNVLLRYPMTNPLLDENAVCCWMTRFGQKVSRQNVPAVVGNIQRNYTIACCMESSR